MVGKYPSKYQTVLFSCHCYNHGL